MLLINNIDLERVSIRCQRLLLKMMRFTPEVKYVPGKNVVVADSLSRSSGPEEINAVSLNEELSSDVDAIVDYFTRTTAAYRISEMI